MKHLITLVITFTCFINTVQAQDSLTNIYTKLLLDTATMQHFNGSHSGENGIKSIFELLLKEYSESQKISGKLTFGFRGNVTDNQELFNLNTGIEFRQGKYPYEINFSSKLDIQIKDGKLQENLSNLKASYDRYVPIKKHPLLLEWYVFMARTGNQFMGVNQRYESGGGFTISLWKKFKNTDTTSNYGRLKHQIKYFDSTNTLAFCSGVCKVDTILSPAEKRTIGTSRFNVLQYLRIKETKVRIALLAGLFYEAESISFADSLSTINGTEYIPHDFEATNHFRFNLRPTFDFHLSNLTLKIRPHFKLPLTSDWIVERDGRSVYDMRFELPVSLGVAISKSFSLSVEYRLFHDQAPNSYLTSFVATDGQPVYLTANRNNHVTRLSVIYNF